MMGTPSENNPDFFDGSRAHGKAIIHNHLGHFASLALNAGMKLRAAGVKEGNNKSQSFADAKVAIATSCTNR